MTALVPSVSAGASTFGIRFEHEAEHDVVYVYPVGVIDSAELLARFENECVTNYASFGRKVDVIVTLEKWSVASAMAADYHNVAASIMQRHNRYVVVVDPSPTVMLRITTSTAIRNVIGFAADMNEALDELIRMRHFGA